MAHVQKFTRGSASGILRHIERENENYSNENINQDLTCFNYNFLFGDSRSAHQRLKKRLAEIKVLNRKDVNVICDWIVTAPEEVINHELSYTEFFGETFEFLKNRYGEKNIVAAQTHFDEITPHIHFAFVPVVYDQKKGIEKCCANDLINRKELQSFHTDLQNYFLECKNIKLSLLNGKTKSLGGNRTVDQLKSENFILETALERNKEVNQKLREERKTFEAEAEEVKQYQISEIKKLNSEINILTQEKQDLHTSITQIENDFLSKENIEDLENLPTKQVFNYTTLKTTDFEEMVSEINFHRSKAEETENIYQKRKNKLDQREAGIDGEVENRLLERLEKIRGNVDMEIEEKRLKAQNEAQKDKEKHLEEIKKLKDQQTQIQKNIDFLKAEEEKLQKNLNIDHKEFDIDNFDPSKYSNLVSAKLDLEFELYLQLLKNNDIDYITSKSFETYYKDCIVISAENMQFTEKEQSVLLTTDHLLDRLYDDWMDYEFDEMEGYLGSFEKTTQKIVDQHKPKESLLVRAEEKQKQKNIGYEPEI